MKFLYKLKERWGIESTLQVIVILIVFACTGFTALYARKFVFGILGIPEDWAFWKKMIVWLLTILPLYNVFLYFYGVLFGQRKFFTLFLKKSVGRLIPSKKK